MARDRRRPGAPGRQRRRGDAPPARRDGAPARRQVAAVGRAAGPRPPPRGHRPADDVQPADADRAEHRDARRRPATRQAAAGRRGAGVPRVPARRLGRAPGAVADRHARTARAVRRPRPRAGRRPAHRPRARRRAPPGRARAGPGAGRDAAGHRRRRPADPLRRGRLRAARAPHPRRARMARPGAATGLADVPVGARPGLTGARRSGRRRPDAERRRQPHVPLLHRHVGRGRGQRRVCAGQAVGLRPRRPHRPRPRGVHRDAGAEGAADAHPRPRGRGAAAGAPGAGRHDERVHPRGQLAGRPGGPAGPGAPPARGAVLEPGDADRRTGPRPGRRRRRPPAAPPVRGGPPALR